MQVLSRAALLILFVVSAVSAFRVSRVLPVRAITTSSRMSTVDPMDEIRAKMEADPSYNPMSDPQAMQVLEGMLPDELKEIPNAIDRMRVALQNAMTGADAVKDIDAAAAGFTNKQDLISTPTSAWMKAGMPNDNPAFSETLKAEYYDKIRQENPDVPVV